MGARTGALGEQAAQCWPQWEPSQPTAARLGAGSKLTLLFCQSHHFPPWQCQWGFNPTVTSAASRNPQAEQGTAQRMAGRAYSWARSTTMAWLLPAHPAGHSSWRKENPAEEGEVLIIRNKRAGRKAAIEMFSVPHQLRVGWYNMQFGFKCLHDISF